MTLVNNDHLAEAEADRNVCFGFFVSLTAN